MSKTGSRFAVFLFNVVIALLSAAAFAATFVGPLWKIKADYLLKEETLESLLGEQAQDVDLAEVVGEGVSLALSVEITTGDAIASFTDADAKASVNRVLEGNVDSLVDQLVPALNGIAEKFVRSAAKRGVKGAVTEQVKNFLKQNDPDVTDERVAALLEKAGFTDAYIAEQTDKIFDAVYEDGATVDSVSQKAADTVEEVFKKLEESGESEFAGAALSEENKAEIKTTFSDALAAVAGEDGTLDAENLVSNLLLQFLRVSESEKDASRSAGTLSSAKAAASEDSAAAEDAAAELKAEIKSALMEKISDDTADKIVLALRIACGVLCFVCFTWAWLILKILVKLFSRNPAIKLKLPIWLGWLPFLLLVLLPLGAVRLIGSGAIGGEAFSALRAFLSDASLSFSSSGWVAFAAAVALIVISIPYGILRRRLARGKRERDDE